MSLQLVYLHLENSPLTTIWEYVCFKNILKYGIAWRAHCLAR